MQFIQCQSCQRIQRSIEAEHMVCFECKSPINSPEFLSEDEIFVDNSDDIPYCLKASRKSAIQRQQEAMKKDKRHRTTQNLMANGIVGQSAESQRKSPLAFLNSFFA